MDNEYDQSKVAYEVSPKETNDHKRQKDGGSPFKKLSDTMPQEMHTAKKYYKTVKTSSRYKEYR